MGLHPAAIPERSRPRPAGVLVVAAFLYAGAGIALFTASLLLWPGTHLDRLWRLNESAHAGFATLGRASAILLVAVGAATFVAARGLLRRRLWAWWLAVGIFATNVAGDSMRLLQGDWLKGAAGLLIGGSFLMFLVLPRVRRHFAR